MTEKEVKPQADCFRGSGLVWALLSAFAYSVQTFLVARLPQVPFFELCFIRFVTMALSFGAIVLITKQSFVGDSDDRLSLWIRSLLGTTTVCFIFYALHHMPLGDATVIYMSAPAFVGIMAFFILKESCGVFEVLTTIIMLSAVTLIAQPPFIFGSDHDNVTVGKDHPPDYGRLIAATSALCGALTYAGMNIAVRRLKHVHFATMLFTHTTWGSIQTGILAFISGSWVLPVDPLEWLMMFGVGACSVVSQVFLTLAMQTENAGAVSILRGADIVFAYMWQVLFLNEKSPNVYTITGAVLVLGNIIAYGLRKLWRSKKSSTADKAPDEETQLVLESNVEKSDITEYSGKPSVGCFDKWKRKAPTSPEVETSDEYTELSEK